MKTKMSLVLAAALFSLLSLGMVGAALAPVVDNVVKDPTDVPDANTFRTGQREVTVHLDAVEVVANLTPDKKYWFWTFALNASDAAKSKDGTKPTVPGPMIRAKEGDTITIVLTNKMENMEPHNIDFHAAMGPGGGAAVMNVEPGQTAKLTFKALRAGAYIYHCAGEGLPWEHVSHGMYGLIQIDPRDDDVDKGGLPNVDSEFYIGQSDWYTTPITADPVTGNPAAEVCGGIGTPGCADVYDLSGDKAAAEYPVDHYTFNGHTKALTDANLSGDKIMVNQDERVRFFFVTGGPNIGSNWHIIGTIFDRVYTGSPKVFMENEETVYVAPGSAAVFDLITPVPGRYLIVDHALWRVTKGAAGFMHVEPKIAPTGCTVDLIGGGVICSNPGSWPLNIYSPITLGTGH